MTWIAYNLLPGSAWVYPVGLAGLGALGVAAFSVSRVPAMRGFFAAFRHRDFFWTFATRAS